jgi:hypothetical protein
MVIVYILWISGEDDISNVEQDSVRSVLKLFVALAEFSSQTDTSVVGYGESNYPVIRPRQVR